jgi:transmembrane sensor
VYLFQKNLEYIMDSSLIEKFFKGECSQDEVAVILDWFAKEELDPAGENELYRFWKEVGVEHQEGDFQDKATRMLSGINKAIDSKENRLSIAADPVPFSDRDIDQIIKPVRWNWVFKAAATVLLPLGLFWLYTLRNAADEQYVPKIVSVSALPGNQERVELPDGSRVVLNTGSTIAYPESFSDSSRVIELTGEAFFEVKKDSKRPFIVKTQEIETQALGTSFDIKHREKNDEISVALATGSVKIDERKEGQTGQIARLIPGQQLVYNKENNTYRVEAFDPMEVSSWQKGVLYFKKARLNEVVQKLENWYGIEIEIVGKVSSKELKSKYTGSYDNQSLDDVLKGISFVKKFSYEKKGNKLMLKFN